MVLDLPSAYLAGPDVFLRDAVAVGREKVAACRELGLRGLYPLDNEIPPGPDAATRIREGNLAMVRLARVVIADLTPFRGVSCDVGTAFEVGAAAALGVPVVGYSRTTRGLLERTKDHAGGRISTRDGRPFASDGMAVEGFGLFDNLMLAEGLAGFVAADAPDRASGLDVFRRAAAMARDLVSR